LGSWLLTWAAPYEKYAVRGKKPFPTTAWRDFSTHRMETQGLFMRLAFAISEFRHLIVDNLQ
jgi:hypothetical protein